MSLDNQIYHALAEQTADHILVTDPDGLILYVNPAFTTVTGYLPEEVLGKNPRILKSGEHDDGFYAKLWDTVLAGKVFRGMSINKKKDGSLYYEEKTITPVHDEAGKITHLISTGKDVTERVEAEQALAKSEAYSRHILENVLDAVISMDADGRIIRWNNEAEHMFGWPADKIIGKMMTETIVPSQHRKAHDKGLHHYNNTGEGPILNQRLELTGWHADGYEFPIELTVTPSEHNGQTVFHAFARDISERKKQETSEQAFKKELHEKAGTLQAILNSVPGAVFWKDRHSNYLGCNKYFAQLAGITPEEIIGKNDYDMPWEKEQADAFRADDAAVMDSGLPKLGITEPQLQADGTNAWLETNKIALKDMKGNVYGVLGTFVDITDRMQLQEQVQESLHKEQETVKKLAERERFLQTILDTLPGAVFWKDRNSMYLGCNANFAKVAGLTPEEIIGKNDYDMPWEKEQADAFRADDAEVMSSGKYKLGIVEPQLQADGTNAWLETNKIALTDDEGKVYGVLGTFVDVTDRIKLEEQAKASLDQRSRQVNLSTSIAQEIASAPDLNDLYQRVVTQIKEQLGYYHVQLLRNAPVLDTLVLIAGYGEAGQKMMEMNHSMPMGVGLIGQAAKNKQSVLRPNVTEDLNWQSNPLLPKTRSELAIPIRLKDEILGVLDVQSDKIDGISQDDQLLLEGLCGQIAIAIESTTLRQEMEGRLRELNLLQRQMSREGWHKLGKEEKKGYRFDLSGLQKLHSLQEETVPQNGNGAVTEPAQAQKPQLPMKKQLQVRGETIGNFGIEDDPERPLTNEEREIIDAVAQELAEALEAARLFEQTQKALAEQERLASELETVAQVSTAASTILEADELLQSVVDLAKTSFNLYHAHIYLVNETGKKLVLKAGAGNIGRLMSLEGREIGFDEESIVARAARTRKGVLENHVRRTVDFLPHPLLPETQSEMALPMLVGGKLIGILDLQSDQDNFFSDEDLNVQTTLAAQIAVAVENANQYAAQVQTAVKLREVDQLKSEFLASMSHELRTPLNSIIGFADVLLEGLDGDLNDRMEEDVRLIRESGNHLKGLIGDILDMSKIEAGRMDLRYEEIDIVRFTQDLVATASSLAQEKNLYLNLDIDEAVTTVQADRTRLRQIMWNIVGNGIKFTDKGGVTIAIQPQSNYLLCSVRDTGVGIKEEHAEVVFEQFRQIDGGLNRAAGGTGLGMPITKKLVELHGGDIWIESVYGQGSTFFFTLPYEPPRLKSKQANAVAG